MKPAARYSKITPSDIRVVMARTSELEAAGVRVTHLEVGQPDFDTPQPIKDATVQALARGEVGYGPTAGLPRLRAAIADSLSVQHGLGIDPGQVLVTNGGSAALYAALASVVEPGDEVAILEPCWTNLIPMVGLLGASVRLVQTRVENDFQPTAAAIEAAIGPRTKALIVNAPNNPTGAALTGASLALLAAEAERHDLLVVSDEVYDRFYYGDATPSIATLPGMAARTAIVNAFSKTYAMTGWRLGYVALPASLVGPATFTHGFINTSVNTFIQYGALAALADCDEHVAAMRESYEARLRLTLDGLDAMPGVRCTVPAGGVFVFPRFDGEGADDRTFARRLLEEAHVATIPGSAFGPNGRGHLRLSICAPAAAIEAGLDALYGFLTQRS